MSKKKNEAADSAPKNSNVIPDPHIPQGFGAVSTEWELAELELELMGAADRLDTRSLKAIQLWMTGHTPAEAVVMAGYKVEDYTKAASIFMGVVRRPEAKEYVDLAKRISTLRTLREDSFTQLEWLQEGRQLFKMCKGEMDQHIAGISNGEVVEGEAKKSELNNAIKLWETFGKQNDWIKDKAEVTHKGDKVTVSVKDFTKTDHGPDKEED